MANKHWFLQKKKKVHRNEVFPCCAERRRNYAGLSDIVMFAKCFRKWFHTQQNSLITWPLLLSFIEPNNSGTIVGFGFFASVPIEQWAISRCACLISASSHVVISLIVGTFVVLSFFFFRKLHPWQGKNILYSSIAVIFNSQCFIRELF